MSITINDCLKLPIFARAEVIAGFGGLKNEVHSVSVLETTNFYVLLYGLIKKQELIITAFSDAKSDVGEQLKIIEDFSRGGASCIVLFYLGIILLEIDIQIIELANMLDFPIIIMPPFKNDLSYSSVIYEVMELILANKKTSTFWVNKTVEEILAQKFTTFISALEWISKKYESGIFITNFLTEINITTENVDVDLLTSNNLSKLTEECDNNRNTILHNAQEYILSVQPFEFDTTSKMHLFLVDYKKQHNLDTVTNICNIVKTCASIYQYYPNTQIEGEFVNAVMSANSQGIATLSKNLGVNHEHLCGAVFFLYKDEAASNEMLKLYSKINKAFSKNRVRCFFSAINKQIVMLCLSPFLQDTQELTRILEQSVQDNSLEELVVCHNFLNAKTANLSEDFYKFCDCAQILSKLFLAKTTYGNFDLHFASSIGKAISSDIKVDILELIDDELLIETLCVYFIDSGMDKRKTSELMFVHKNTIIYRLQKAKELLHSDFSEGSEQHQLIFSLGIWRILNLFENNKIQ